MALIAAWPREKSEKPAAPAPAVASKDEEFDLEKIIRYVGIHNTFFFAHTNLSATSLKTKLSNLPMHIQSQ